MLASVIFSMTQKFDDLVVKLYLYSFERTDRK
jgi:hypothetical protein